MFIPDYDIGIARTMYHGCDVWLNTPRRPNEACGTSGEKAALNGVLNCSILDGWWAEMSDGENGFDIPSFDDDLDVARRDHREASATFDVIENADRARSSTSGDDGVPHGWVDRIMTNWATARLERRRRADGARLRHRPVRTGSGAHERLAWSPRWPRQLASAWKSGVAYGVG